VRVIKIGIAFWKRGKKDANRATADTVGAAQAEARTGEDLQAYQGGLATEAGIHKDLGLLLGKKYTADKLLVQAHAGLAKLKQAKAAVNGKVQTGWANVRNYLSTAAARATSRGSVSVERDLNFLRVQQEQQIALLERETEITIRDAQAEEKMLAPIIQANKQIRDKLKEWQEVIGNEDRRLLDAANAEIAEIRRSQDAIRMNKDQIKLLIQEIQADKARIANGTIQRGAFGR
jgi:hypothetical protein